MMTRRNRNRLGNLAAPTRTPNCRSRGAVSLLILLATRLAMLFGQPPSLRGRRFRSGP